MRKGNVVQRRSRGGSAGLRHGPDSRKPELESLRRQQNLLESATQATDVMLVLLDRQFNFLWVNKAYAAACRKTPKEMVGKNHFALYPHEENEAIFLQVRDTGRAAFFKDKPFTYPDQAERGVTYWDWSLSPVSDDHGEVTNLVLALRETTPFKRAADALARSRAEHSAMFTAITDALVFTDAERRIVGINPAFTKVFGYSEDEVRGQTTEFLYTSARAYREAGRRRYRRRGSVESGVYEVQYPTQGWLGLLGGIVGQPGAGRSGRDGGLYQRPSRHHRAQRG